MKNINKSKIKNKTQFLKYFMQAVPTLFNARVQDGNINFLTGETFSVCVEQINN